MWMSEENLRTLDQLVDTFPIGAEVENFGFRARVVGYQYSDSLQKYTGELVLSDSRCRWIADTAKCSIVA